MEEVKLISIDAEMVEYINKAIYKGYHDILNGSLGDRVLNQIADNKIGFEIGEDNIFEVKKEVKKVNKFRP